MPQLPQKREPSVTDAPHIGHKVTEPETERAAFTNSPYSSLDWSLICAFASASSAASFSASLAAAFMLFISALLAFISVYAAWIFLHISVASPSSITPAAYLP